MTLGLTNTKFSFSMVNSFQFDKTKIWKFEMHVFWLTYFSDALHKNISQVIKKGFLLHWKHFKNFKYPTESKQQINECIWTMDFFTQTFLSHIKFTSVVKKNDNNK